MILWKVCKAVFQHVFLHWFSALNNLGFFPPNLQLPASAFWYKSSIMASPKAVTRNKMGRKALVEDTKREGCYTSCAKHGEIHSGTPADLLLPVWDCFHHAWQTVTWGCCTAHSLSSEPPKTLFSEAVSISFHIFSKTFGSVAVGQFWTSTCS